MPDIDYYISISRAFSGEYYDKVNATVTNKTINGFTL
jgi:hypothetical protein